MQIKRQDLETIIRALNAAVLDIPGFRAEAISAVMLGQDILAAARDPVDVVPVQDYPFPIPKPMKGHYS